MKHRITSILIVVFFSLVQAYSVLAEDTTVDFTELGKQTWTNYSLTSTSGIITISTNVGTGAAPTTNNAQYRWKEGNIITISTSVGNLKSVQFITNSTVDYGPKNLNYGDSAITSDGTDYTWTAPSGIASASFNVTSETRLTEIHVVYTTASFTITAQSNNTSYGSITQNGNIITGSPNSGYRYADPAFTITPVNSATVTQNGHNFTVIPSENTTITINFEPIPVYTVTLADDSSSLTQASANAAVTLPSREPIAGYSFVGWSETSVSTKTASAPTTIIDAGLFTPTSDITLYPVYSKSEGGNATLNKTASVIISEYASDNSWTNSNRYLSIGIDENITVAGEENGNNSKYYSSSPGTWRHYGGDSGKITVSVANGGTLTSVTFTYSGSTLKYGNTDVDSGTPFDVSGTSAVFTVSGSTGNTQVSAISVSYTIPDSGTTYYWSNPIPPTVEQPSIEVAENPFYFSTTATITCATDGATIKYSFDNENWSEYSSPFLISESKTIYAKAIKNSDESDVTTVLVTKNLAEPTVVISGDLITDLGGGTDVNAGILTANVIYNNQPVSDASVTWSSSNSNIATIDQATGVVTLKAVGDVFFTATFAGDSDYSAASSSKNVKVISISEAVLPFIWNGGVKEDLVELEGVTGYGLGSNYAESNAPYRVKFDNDGDYIMIKTDKQPGVVTVGIKKLGGDGNSSISIQGSSDGYTFTTLEEFENAGKQNNVLSHSTTAVFGSEIRYVKILYIKPTGGANVGVGPITIEKYVPSTINLTGTPADGHYWATFYSSVARYSLSSGAEAYTMNDAHQLYRLGTDGNVVPKNEAVIIISDSPEITLSIDSSETPVAVNGTTNILKGSDTPVSVSDGTPYVLGINGEKLGFYQYNGTTIPENKAYYVVEQ